MAYVNKAEVQQEALKHWKNNLHKTIDMDWEEFKKKRAKADLYFLLKGQIEQYPTIFGSDCSYCQYVKEHRNDFDWDNIVCEGCPLSEYESDNEGDCCKAWEAVYKAFKEAELKSAAIVACAWMIQKIEEDGDRWTW